MWGYIGAFAGGIVAGEAVRLIFDACLNQALQRYEKERKEMERKYNELKRDYAALEQSWNCKQSWEKGRATGRKLKDAERFAENFEGKNIQFRTIKGGSNT